MSSPYDPILTSVGLLSGGKLTKTARNRYIQEVIALLVTGNANGHGGSPTTKIFNSLVPLPPVSGPTVQNVTTLSSEPLFWFSSDPGAALVATLLEDPKNNPFWHTIFLDTLYEKTAVALDARGTTPLFPIFDVSFPFGIDLPIPFTLPELAAKLQLTLPKLTLKLADLGIELKLPEIPLPPIPPNLTFPNFNFPFPHLALPDLLIGLIKLPFDLLLKLVLPPKIDLALNIPGLPAVVLNLALDIVLKLLIDLGLLLIVPKVFVASLLIYIKNVVAMVCTDIVGMLLGAGNFAKGAAILTGLV